MNRKYMVYIPSYNDLEWIDPQDIRRAGIKRVTMVVDPNDEDADPVELNSEMGRAIVEKCDGKVEKFIWYLPWFILSYEHKIYNLGYCPDMQTAKDELSAYIKFG